VGAAVQNTTYDYTLTCYEGLNASGPVTGVATAQATTPNVTVTGVCPNGANNPPDCNVCPASEIYDGVRCVSIGVATMCGGTVTNYPAGQTSVGTGAICGNGVIEIGEQCDGAVGIVDGAVQQCSAQCVLSCKNGGVAPGCGLPATSYCTNGALQTTAPACNVCPAGQTYDSGTNSCLTPVCGNGVKEGGEACDGTDGITNAATQACTYGCCITSPNTPGCYPDLEFTCPGATSYAIYNGATPVVATTSYPAGPISFTPTTGGNYRLACSNMAQYYEYAFTITGTCPVINQAVLPGILLSGSPKTIKRGGTTALTWNISNPTDVCKVVALPVITSPTATCNRDCVVARQTQADNLSRQLRNGTTDSSDPFGGARSMSTALNTLVGGKAQGKKTVQLNYSTIFQASCELNPLQDPRAVRVRVQVADDIEG
jgi:hypothetical protein